jgi:hypothetical protein
MSTQPQQQTAAPAAEETAPKPVKKQIPFAKTGGLCPTDFADMYRLAEVISASDLAPKDFRGKPANCLVAIQLGAEVGLSPMQAIQNIAVINGRPTIWGDAMLGLCRGSGLWIEADYDEHIDGDGDNMVAVCTVCRAGGKPQTTRFSVADAKKAKLWGKSGPWTEYPKRMLTMRARSWRLRDSFADVLKGLHETSEAERIDAMLGQIDLSSIENLKERLAAPAATDDDAPDAEAGTLVSPQPAEAPAPVDDQERIDLIAEIDVARKAASAAGRKAALEAAGLTTKNWQDADTEALRTLLEHLTAAPPEPVDDLALLQKAVIGHVTRTGTKGIDVCTRHGVFASKVVECLDAGKLELIRDELAKM